MLGTRCLAWILTGVIVLAGCDAQHPANAPIAAQDLTRAIDSSVSRPIRTTPAMCWSS
jgi:hypothetical protein